MSAETSKSPSDVANSGCPSRGTWTDLEAVVDELGQLARSGAPAEEFYRQSLACSVQAMAATGGRAWLKDTGGLVIPAAAIGELPGMEDENPAARADHEELLARVLAEGGVQSVNISELRDVAPPTAGSLTEKRMLMLAAVPVAQYVGHSGKGAEVALDGSPRSLAILEIALAAGASPAAVKGQECFLAAVAEIASEYHAYQELAQLRQNQLRHQQLQELSRQAHLAGGLRQAAYVVASEGRRVISCDRLSVLVPSGRRCRLLAVSGVKRVDRRSFAARELERLAQLCLRLQEPIIHRDDETHAETHSLPQVAEQVQSYVDQSHARQLTVIPVMVNTEDANVERQSERHDRWKKTLELPKALLIAEQFGGAGEELSASRVREVCDVCATAFHQAAEWDRLPLRWLFVLLGRIRDLFLPRHFPKTLLAAVAAAGVIAALLLVDADFSVEASGTMQPVVRRNVFASRSGLVDEVLVQHGDAVTAGQELVRLRDPELDLEWYRIRGDLQTTAEQLDAVQASKASRAAGGLTAIDTFRLSADESQLKQKLENMRQEIALLEAQRKELVIRSPLAGHVVTWDVSGVLTARPVDRGQVLLTVADLDDRWRLELDVADDRLGYLLAAREELADELPVEYRLTADQQREFRGHVSKIAGLVELADSDDTNPIPTVRVHVALEESNLQPGADKDHEFRPGMTARARIHCGQRCLAYVWFHDIWDTVVRWTTF